MDCANTWIRGAVGIDSGLAATRTGCRTVLVMVPSVAAGTRLLDLLPLVEADHRVQAVFTVPKGDDAWHGVEDFVRAQGGIVVPWTQAVRERWDLVLTASNRHVEQVHGKVLNMPHGAGALKSLRRSRKANSPSVDATGLDRELLTYRGRVLSAALALSHDLELVALRRTCPEAVPVAVVAGDLCLDRMTASLRHRDRYRKALGVADGQQLVVVSSTWSPDSTFGRRLDLYERLMTEAGSRTRVAAVLHPMIATAHGARQVRAWLAGALERGLLVIPPHEGWRAAMIAADRVIGDFGSTTAYAAAIGRPVHLAAFPEHAVRPGSIAASLAGIAPRLDPTQAILPQLCPGPAWREHRRVAELISGRPGSAARIHRRIMYRLLGIEEPSWPATSAPIPLPVPEVGHGY